jgi:hypothetical protein
MILLSLCKKRYLSIGENFQNLKNLFKKKMRRSPSSDERVELLTVPQGSGFKKVTINRPFFFPKDTKIRANVSLVSNESRKFFFSAYFLNEV